MNRRSINPILAPLAGAVICFVLGPWPGAAGMSAVMEALDGRAVGVSGGEDGGRIGIYIERWSTDEEAAILRAPLAEGSAEGLIRALQLPAHRVGVVLLPGVQSHGARTRMRTPKNLVFAREIATETGRRVILASDEHLGIGEPRIAARKELQEFNVMDIRFGADGTGVGKIATASDVVYDPATKSLAMKAYETLPVRLVDVKSNKF
jgi:hypothetical protein